VLHVSCYIAPILTACQFFNFLFIAYVQYNFYMCIARVTSSHFAKYFGDTHSEYITPRTVMSRLMLYESHLCDYTPYSHELRSGPTEWILPRTARKRKLANCLSYSEHWINFHFIYYPLYMLIMQVYHDSGHMLGFSRMPESGRKI
jgi:hypothetical protein